MDATTGDVELIIGPHSALGSEFVGPNSPGKRASKSQVWESTKRLRGGHPEIANGMTHVCCAKLYDDDGMHTGFCNHFMK
jgi:hypothetical protein